MPIIFTSLKGKTFSYIYRCRPVISPVWEEAEAGNGKLKTYLGYDVARQEFYLSSSKIQALDLLYRTHTEKSQVEPV